MESDFIDVLAKQPPGTFKKNRACIELFLNDWWKTKIILDDLHQALYVADSETVSPP